MFTMAGETFLIIGDRDGTGVSPMDDGMAAETGAAVAARARSTAQARETARPAREMALPARGTARNLAGELAGDRPRNAVVQVAQDGLRITAMRVRRDLNDLAGNGGFIGRS
jgi:hypothetical protein